MQFENNTPENTPPLDTPLEHQNVPAAHQGLHGFLYSSDDEHQADAPTTTAELAGTEIIAVPQWLEQTTNSKVAGVYGVLDSDRTYQYIGYSRDVIRSLKGHISQNGAEVCSFVRVQTFKFPKRQAMEALKAEWINELNYTPAGNSGGGETWAKTIGEAAKATMTSAERDAYEDKKLKLRKAMADAALVNELAAQDNQSVAPSDAEAVRRQKLEAAVENDDWSSVIESQN